MMRSILYFTFLLFPFFPSHNLIAQNGAIRGKVLDSESKEEIIGANVFIEGTTKGASTDINGNFAIGNLEAGSYTIMVTYVAYMTQRFENVVVKVGEITTLNVSLAEDVATLESIVVTGVRETATDIALIQSIKGSMQVVSGISAESISRSLDSDASQVVKRVPGVTVIQDRFIVIRGLNERYNTTLLHNINVPSMEADVRAFSFDVLPSSIIDRVMIYKSPAPELSGDFSGGAVKIFSKGIPAENGLILDVSTGYRQGSSLRTFRAESRRPYYWTGLNDGANDLPANFPERLTGLPNADRDQAGLSLPNNWTEQEYNSGLDYKVTLTHNFRRKLGVKGMEIGNITSVQYANTKTVFNVANRAFEAYDFVNNSETVRYRFEDTEYGQEIMHGLVHNWALRINKNHFIEFKNLYNQLTTFDFIDRFGDQVAQGFTQNNFAFFNEYRGLYSGQLIGNHTFFDESASLEWIGGYGRSYNQLPDYRRFRRNVLDPETMESVLFVPRGQTPDFLGKFYSEMEENMYSAALNYEQKINHNNERGFKPLIKAGLYLEDRQRTFSARNLGFSRGTNFDESLTQLPIEELFAPENINAVNGIRIGENFSSSNFFVASNRLRAYYLSVNLPFGPFNLMGGVRVEDNLQQLRSPDRFQEGTDFAPIQPVVIEQLIPLPSATLSYDLTEKMKIKGVYGKTINRPEFREIAPFGFYDFVFDATVTGFSDLRNAEIQNFDLRWELYPSINEAISFALFYKDFKNPIESLYGNFGSEQSTFLFRNTERAFARGVELDLRKSLANVFNSPFLNKISLLANVSLIDSEVTLGEDLADLLRATNRPLQGQSNFIVNTGVFYENFENRLQVNVLYNVIGKRILLVGAGPIPDTYEMPRNVIDISIRKGLTDRLYLKAGIKDLLNQEFLLLQDGNEDGVFDRKNDQIFRRFRPGTTYSLGLSYEL